MAPSERVRCPAFIGKDGNSPCAVVHYGPCPFIHPFETGWSRAPSPDATTIEAFLRQMPVRGAPRSAEQELMEDVFGADSDADEDVSTQSGPGGSAPRKIPQWKDLTPATVAANLGALNSALAQLEYPTLEVDMDGMDTGEGPSVSFSATGGYTYPHEVQYSRPFNTAQTFAQSWAEMEKNAQKQWDVAHGAQQLRPAGVIGGHMKTRPVVMTAGPSTAPGPTSPATPRSPDLPKRRRESGGPSVKTEPSLSNLASSAKRPRREDTPFGQSMGEQLRAWRTVLQPMLRPESREGATREKMRELSKIIEQLEEAKDDISRDVLGKLVDRGGTKMGLVVRKLAEVKNMPFEDVFHVVQRAGNLTRYWSAKFGVEDGDAG
ncbi:hypothetical protein CALVIDRAFT_539085 [Calocera viscosa TUFC12733]|uniref:Uncharacterized protein n=1 Tax=Calocera viscosa (strain TUFC12733) TaxID=1330018 RepID=A0A167K6Z4_CALVF|nr:hypothetical protein CALVIDRAFT_539085 [Calocera viscosa TUFC12733]